MTPQEIRAHVAKREKDIVARRMIVFAKGNDILSLRLANPSSTLHPPKSAFSEALSL
jgi:hypothetical protein